jgi:hypothetical protein
MTRTAPKRSATAPAKGCPTPQSRFWIAMARPKISRPQPYSCVIGIWNSPAVARGPKVISAMAQPAKTMNSGEKRREAGTDMGALPTGARGRGR